MYSCADRGEKKTEKEDPLKEIEAAKDSIPTDGADLGEKVNAERDTTSQDSTSQDSTTNAERDSL